MIKTLSVDLIFVSVHINKKQNKSGHETNKNLYNLIHPVCKSKENIDLHLIIKPGMKSWIVYPSNFVIKDLFKDVKSRLKNTIR